MQKNIQCTQESVLKRKSRTFLVEKVISTLSLEVELWKIKTNE